MKLINDTLKNKDGKWARKSLTAFAAFHFAIIYEFLMPFFGLKTNEYVFVTLMTLVGAVLGLTVWDKTIGNEKID